MVPLFTVWDFGSEAYEKTLVDIKVEGTSNRLIPQEDITYMITTYSKCQFLPNQIAKGKEGLKKLYFQANHKTASAFYNYSGIQDGQCPPAPEKLLDAIHPRNKLFQDQRRNRSYPTPVWGDSVVDLMLQHCKKQHLPTRQLVKHNMDIFD